MQYCNKREHSRVSAVHSSNSKGIASEVGKQSIIGSEVLHISRTIFIDFEYFLLKHPLFGKLFVNLHPNNK